MNCDNKAYQNTLDSNILQVGVLGLNMNESFVEPEALGPFPLPSLDPSQKPACFVFELVCAVFF